MLPNTLDIRITGYCNLNCLVCFGPSFNAGHMNIKNLLKFIKIFPNFGVLDFSPLAYFSNFSKN
jgi:molybdenum cofactor biosynthesis enzyme MoaA